MIYFRNLQTFPKIPKNVQKFQSRDKIHKIESTAQERILGWPYLGIDLKCLPRLAEYDNVIRGPFLVLPQAPPTLNSPLLVALVIRLCRLRLLLR